MLEFYFPPVLFLDQDNNFSFAGLLVLKGQDSSKPIPYKLVINSIRMQTFFKNPIGLQKDILGHPSFIAAELVILFAVGHVDGYI